MSVCVHVVAGYSWSQIFDETQTKRATTVLVSLELRNGGLCCVGSIKSDNTRTTRAATGLILDLSLLDLANCGEKLD